MKPFTIIAIIVFTIISLFHFLRWFLGWTIVINSLVMPLWLNIASFLIPGVLAVMLWREMKPAPNYKYKRAVK
jgi:membrane protein implicated in regulation of membrane protease activity